MIITNRHSKDLKWSGKRICAPRTFKIGDYNFYVHIYGFYCERVVVYLEIRPCQCVVFGTYRTYGNTKGIYFNFTYRGERNRIYLGE